jgi:hypothetical protein
MRASCASVVKPVDPGDLADQLRRDQHAEALLCQQLWGDLCDEAGELLVELGDRAGQFPDPGDHVARDLHLDGGRGSTETPGDLGLPRRVDQDALGDLPLGPEVVQLPAQLVDQPGPGVHEPPTMQRQQPDLELGAGKPGGRERVDAFPQRGAGDRERVDRIGLPALPDPFAGLGHQPGWEPDDRLAAIDQEPLQASGHVPDVLDHPHPLAVELTSPLQQLTEPLTSCSDRSLRDLHPSALTATPVCVCLCGSIPIVNIMSVPSSNDPMKRTPGGHYSVGALPSSYQVTPGRP